MNNKSIKDLAIFMCFSALVLFSMAFLLGCKEREVVLTIAELQKSWNEVKICTNAPNVEAPNLRMVKGANSLPCGNTALAPACYRKSYKEVVLPEFTELTTIKHQLVHHVLFMTSGSVFETHDNELFLKCSGVIIENDTT